jgi:4-alpha-glucanotransferase
VPSADASERGLIRNALDRLGIERFVLAVHDASFPAATGEDVGRGTPYARVSAGFFDFVAARGFDGVQLGPQGKTSLTNPSPYDGAVLARSHLSVALARLVDEPGYGGLLPADLLARAAAQAPRGSTTNANHQHAWQATLAALRIAYRRFEANPDAFPALQAAAPAFFAAHTGWLDADGLFEALTIEHGTDDVAQWWRRDDDLDQRLCNPRPEEAARAEARRTALHQTHADVIAFHRFVQLLLHVQHGGLRARVRGLGLRLFADFQVGLSPRDRWQRQALFLPGYAIGAPASRTNPLGQAWGYPVLDPDGFHGAAPGLRFFEQRLARLFADFDGLRIDHPHGIISPWVYRDDAADPLASVAAGARLFDSPDLPDHPALARHAIAKRSDLAPADEHRPRYAEDWVRRLDDAQVARYAVLMDRVIDLARAHGIESPDVCAEVLSTCPFPIARVLARHGLGRLRVVQKADPSNPGDPYRSETAAPADWITLGTHDTRSIWPVVQHWHESGTADAWSHYLAARLAPDEATRPTLATQIANTPNALVAALAADLFVGPARHVSVFFPDLFGIHDRYNVPGAISDSNWTLRVPADFACHYQRARAAGTALDLRLALATALRARTRNTPGDTTTLATALETTAR